jgi:gliding motility-associated-like protein
MTRDISGDISFLLTLTDIAGCSFQYNIQLLLNKKDIEITFPNIFSPNGDGFNDFYEVKSTTSQQISRLTIFDRWGSQLFNKNREPDQESIIWDGKSHDKTIQPGVYIYLAEITDKNGNRKYVSGDLTISF